MSDMKAEERAKAFWRTPAPDKYERRPIELLAETIREAEQAAAARAREEMKEACANIADRAATSKLFNAGARQAAKAVAAAIRARSRSGSQG